VGERKGREGMSVYSEAKLNTRREAVFILDGIDEATHRFLHDGH
jgi:hypothetical protein